MDQYRESTLLTGYSDGFSGYFYKCINIVDILKVQQGHISHNRHGTGLDIIYV